jgi:5-oxoprolinase (ATP-hydrolysing)
VRVSAASGTPPLESPGLDFAGDPQPPLGEPSALRRERVWFPGVGRVEAPVFERESLAPGAQLRGPAIVLEDTGTIALDPGFAARLRSDGILVLEDESGAVRPDPLDLSQPDPIRLEVFGNRFMSIAEQMGAVLRKTSVSTNIKERLDYSCAVFDGSGALVANAPHIPVHLGAMAETVSSVRVAFPELRPGDVVATNDPAHGGSHLPDVTAVTPVFCGAATPAFFVASRGHHADIGGLTPGSMPADSTTLEEEGVVLRAFLAVREGRFEEERLRAELGGARYPARNPDDNVAELEAMVAANRSGVALLEELVAERGRAAVEITMEQLQRATAQKVAREIGRLPDGVHQFADALDDGTPVCVALAIEGERMRIDFAGTGAAVAGNLNAPRAVVQAAVIYVLRALVAERIPLNGGCLDPVEISIPAGSLLDPPAGAAVAGGNVETSQRIVDVLLGALAVVAASQGTMNNVAFGDANFGYYETIGGGAGAGEGFDGASGVHTHMTNTRITDAEVLEARHPVRLLRFALRRDSGGAGRWRGGDGLERHYEFCAPVTVSLLGERRTIAPWGLAGGEPGARGRNSVERSDGRVEEIAGKATLVVETGDRLLVETPGGGGFGPPE